MAEELKKAYEDYAEQLKRSNEMTNYVTLSDLHQNQADVLRLLAEALEARSRLSQEIIDAIREVAESCQNKAEIEAKCSAEDGPPVQFLPHCVDKPEVRDGETLTIRPQSEVKAEAYQEVLDRLFAIIGRASHSDTEQTVDALCKHLRPLIKALEKGELPDDKEAKQGEDDTPDNTASFGHSDVG